MFSRVVFPTWSQLLAASVVGVLALSTGVRAEVPPVERSELIAFSGVHWDADLNPASSQIYVVREDGTRLRRITHTGAWEDTAPAWSPDGRRLAFGRRTEAGWRLLVMNASGSQLRALTRPQPLAGSPSWSPDGKEIAFVQLSSCGSGAECRVQQLYVVSLGTGRLRQLTRFASFHGGVGSPAWSPDGTRILFWGKQSPAEHARADLWGVDPRGTGLRRLIADATDPAWSADGRVIAFVRSGDVHTARADGTRVRRVTRTRDYESRPSWSPDGASIAFDRDHSPKDPLRETRRVYVAAVDGTKARPITPADPRFWADAPSWRPALGL